MFSPDNPFLPKMMGQQKAKLIPASCQKCGAIFESDLFTFHGNNTNVKLGNNYDTCPFCGGLSKLAEGCFDIVDNIITVLSGPEITRDMLKKIAHVASESYLKSKTENEFFADVSEIDPEISGLLNNIKGQSTFFNTILLLIILFAAKSCNLNINIDANKLIDQFKSTNPSQIILLEKNGIKI